MRDNSLQAYQRDWNALEILPGWVDRVMRMAERVAGGRARYERVAPVIEMDWAGIGAIHALECDLSWEKGLHSGESWRRRTQLEERGRGPFASWEEAAIDALRAVRATAPFMWDGSGGWSVAELGRWLEMFNGGGYLRKGKRSPYIVSGSTLGVGVGKYTGDGIYSAEAVSAQVGAFCILWGLARLGVWVPKMLPLRNRVMGYGDIGPLVKSHQTFLNSVRSQMGATAFEVLDVDGKWFGDTEAAHAAVYGRGTK